MANLASKLSWKVLTLAIGIPVGIIARKSMDATWRAARPDDPSHEPRDPNARWHDAVGWAVLSGVAVAGAQVATSKGAATVWRNLIGSEPPAKGSKAARKRAVSTRS